MLKQFGPSTVVALLTGGALAVLLFVPVAASRYRRAGRLRLLDLFVLIAVAVYFMALWSYTLVPFPDADHIRCTAAQLRPFQFLRDIRNDPRPLMHNRALLQAVFNVILFAPLGFFLRVLLRRGVVLATVMGCGVSALIELTQLTGVWGTYRCAYRVFDVDDLMLNTAGALLGSLAAIPVVALLSRRRPVPKATRVTFGRRAVGVAADLLAIGVVGALLAAGWRAVELYGLGWDLDDLLTWPEQLLALGVPAAIELFWVLSRGQTFGEAAVGLEPVVTTGSVMGRRLVKYLAGVGGYLVLSAGLLPGPSGIAIFVAISVVALAVTRQHRGLSHVVAGMELRVRGVAQPAVSRATDGPGESVRDGAPRIEGARAEGDAPVARPDPGRD